MNFRQASAGAARQAGKDPTESDVIRPNSLQEKTSLEEYLCFPKEKRLGICCSGGGIRSASYCVGALQVLRNAGVLNRAEYLSAVSGGCFTAIAHATIVAATGGDFKPSRDMARDEVQDPPATNGDSGEARHTMDEERIKKLIGAFGLLAPWAMNSPEERNLRVRPGYLASGALGWIWLVGNMVYGVVRHLLPFAAGIIVAGGVTGFAFHRWVNIRHEDVATRPALWVALALLGVAGVGLVLRQSTQSGGRPSGSRIQTLQTWILTFTTAAMAVFFLLFLLPELLVTLRRLGTEAEILRLVGIGTVGFGGFIVILAFLMRRGRAGRVAGSLLLVVGPLVLLIAYVGIAYWATLNGLHWRRAQGDPWPLWFVVGSAAVLIILSFLDQVTANMHMFYRERLATIFISERVGSGANGLEHAEPPWSTSLYFSDLRAQNDLSARGGPKSAVMPKLVVCASVTLSDAVPPGRNAASFTFEQDWSGGPATNYVRTSHLERRAGKGKLTLPAMMAISGAAIAPSMGRRTRPGLRLLLAMFNIRLGVWLPNPRSEGGIRTSAVRQWIDCSQPDGGRVDVAEAESTTESDVAPDSRLRRPGGLYVLREALGINSVKRPYVYVTDGGHWDNLGLVELLRRGCTQILCFDASGGDAAQFHTLSNAISLARSDLGVTITMTTEPLEPRQDGFTSTDVVRGDILYPDGTEGILVYAKSVLPLGAPPDLVSFRQVDPKFPNHSTADQFFDERKYESYRALGYDAALHAVAEINAYRSIHDEDVFERGDLTAAERQPE